MRTRNGTMKSLAAVAAAVVLASMFGVWTEPAEAIIIVNSKTGMFTLTTRDAVRTHILNTTEEAGIIIVNSIFDSSGMLLAESAPMRIPFGHAQTFEYTPDLPDGTRMPVRAVVTVQGAKKRGFIPSIEVFDRETGRTCCFVDFIIDDGDVPVQ